MRGRRQKLSDQARRLGHIAGKRSVYFAEKDGLIKIGSSAQVGLRVASLGATLLAVDPYPFPEGTILNEKMTHSAFHHLRVHGEWFRPGPELTDHIAALNRGEGGRRLIGTILMTRVDAARAEAS